MLNEIQEYKEYVTPKEKGFRKRLKNDTLLRRKEAVKDSNGKVLKWKVEWSGLDRALTIIARNKWFEDNSENEDVDVLAKEKKVRNDLRDWMYDTLPNYINRVLLKEVINELFEEEKTDEIILRIDELINNIRKIDKARTKYYTLNAELNRQSKKTDDHSDEEQITKSELEEAEKKKEEIENKHDQDVGKLKDYLKNEIKKSNNEKITAAVAAIDSISDISNEEIKAFLKKKKKKKKKNSNYNKVTNDAVKKLKEYRLVCDNNSTTQIRKKGTETNGLTDEDKNLLKKSILVYLDEKKDDNLDDGQITKSELEEAKKQLKEDLKKKIKKNTDEKINKAAAAIDAISVIPDKERSFFYNNNEKDNDYKKISYERIIANAVIEGKLKEYYLVCSNNNIDKVKKNGNKKIDDKDRILKCLAAYLLEKKQSRGCVKSGKTVSPFYYINYQDISNWIYMDKRIKYTDIKKYEYDGEILFEKEDSTDKNVAKIRINANWLKDGGWDVIESDKLEKYKEEHSKEDCPNATIFIDEGACKQLKEEKLF